MRWRRRRLTARDRLTIQVALASQIEQAITQVKDAPRSPELNARASEAASYITAQHNLAARYRGRGEVADQCDRWNANLVAAITEAVARQRHL